MATTLNYVDIDNLRAFWAKAKEYIDNQISGTNATINTLSGKVDGEIARSTGKDTEHTNAIAEIKGYTVNGIALSTSPVVLTSENISLGKAIYNKTADTSLYDFFQTLVLNIELYKTYINSHKDSGGHKAEKITLDPIINSKANVQEALADLDTRLNNEAAKQYVSSVSTEGGEMVTLTTNPTSGEVKIAVDDTAVKTLKADFEGHSHTAAQVAVDPAVNGKSTVQAAITDLNTRLNSEVAKTYVSSVVASKKGDITVSPTTADTGDVTVEVDATSLTNRVGALEGRTYTSTVTVGTNGEMVKLSTNPSSGEVKIAVDDTAVQSLKSNFEGHSHTASQITVDPAVSGKSNVQAVLAEHKNLIAALNAGKQVVGVVSSLPAVSDYKVGDVVIVGQKEYICAPKNSTTNDWYLLGDTTEESNRITALENALNSKPSLSASNNKIFVTAYGQTSQEGFTVPYATSAGSATTAGSAGSATTAGSAGRWNNSITISLSGDATGDVTFDGSANATLDVTVGDDSHNHSKLSTSAGSATKPVYFKDGKPTECSFGLNADVPAGAVFTDTKNTAGASNSTSTLFLVGTTKQTTGVSYSNINVKMSGGSIYANDFITTSDRRLKKNIVEVTDEMLEKTLDLNVYEFDYRNTDEHSVGYIAQEVQEVLPVMVKGNKCSDGEEFLAVKYTPIHTMQIKALNNKVNQLTTENKELKSRLEKLEKLVEKLM